MINNHIYIAQSTDNITNVAYHTCIQQYKSQAQGPHPRSHPKLSSLTHIPNVTVSPFTDTFLAPNAAPIVYKEKKFLVTEIKSVNANSQKQFNEKVIHH